MKGSPSFTAKREFHGLELPKGTILEVELINEFQGEVCIIWPFKIIFKNLYIRVVGREQDLQHMF